LGKKKLDDFSSIFLKNILKKQDSFMLHPSGKIPQERVEHELRRILPHLFQDIARRFQPINSR